jgi:periplasmic protein TonB
MVMGGLVRDDPSARTRWPMALGVALALHAAGVAATLLVRTPPLRADLPEDAAVELVFLAPTPPEPVAAEPEPVAVPEPAPEPEPVRVEAPKPLPAEVPPPPPPPRPAQRPAPAAPPRVLASRPAPMPAAPPPPPAAAPVVTAPSAAWRTALTAWLARHRTYPEAARRRGIEGTVTLRFNVDPGGRVGEVDVALSSGSAILDAAAETLLRNAALPPPDDRFTVLLPIRYRLEE